MSGARNLFAGPTPTERDLTGLGRDTIVNGLQSLHRAGAKLLAERDAYFENLTTTQARCTELLAMVRLSRFIEAHPEIKAPLLDLAWAIDNARAKHPRGPDGIRSLAEEVGEVANAMRRETPDRVREELLDVAVVAMRLFMGESDGVRP
jgi:hypothetical protein